MTTHSDVMTWTYRFVFSGITYRVDCVQLQCSVAAGRGAKEVHLLQAALCRGWHLEG